MNFIESFPYYSSGRIRSDLKARGAAARKSMGQNFLIEPNALKRIAGLLAAPPDSIVLEIGPGLGSLSLALIQEKFRVQALEIDPVFVSILEDGFEGCDEFQVQQVDARQALKNSAAFDNISFVCANLPYYCSTELLELIVRNVKPAHALFLLQKEFVDRVAGLGSQSSLAVYLGNFGNWQRIMLLKAANFFPKPTVDSALLSFQYNAGGPQVDPGILEALLRMSYLARRKKILNSWKQDRRDLINLDLLMQCAKEIGIDTDLRAEEIPHQLFYALASRLAEVGKY